MARSLRLLSWEGVALLPTLTLLLSVSLAGPALAKVLAEGKPKGGFYWQKIENGAGKVSYMCRAQQGSKLSANASCESAKAPKP
jgi:hypothetical protein